MYSARVPRVFRCRLRGVKVAAADSEGANLVVVSLVVAVADSEEAGILAVADSEEAGILVVVILAAAALAVEASVVEASVVEALAGKLQPPPARIFGLIWKLR